jgi:hypothetical protein
MTGEMRQVLVEVSKGLEEEIAKLNALKEEEKARERRANLQPDVILI